MLSERCETTKSWTKALILSYKKNSENYALQTNQSYQKNNSDTASHRLRRYRGSDSVL